ncbi:hypothetical protein BU26DRAFT_507787 [Trematosphaeria pertusa]|uniref:Uncharacterized protein n=1 Tax=Trematosphaeria pertusa TaxID=390896 RepID=A0A6A6I9G7_9PLEO|nr:uncharacterized protein BU26DRAFT_507787 [Trematosphaeria pertusa]KAF2246163.1 hypothetical protein BU26DRAFT_507787 [Trematosphaeria pertusa]
MQQLGTEISDGEGHREEELFSTDGSRVQTFQQLPGHSQGLEEPGSILRQYSSAPETTQRQSQQGGGMRETSRPATGQQGPHARTLLPSITSVAAHRQPSVKVVFWRRFKRSRNNGSLNRVAMTVQERFGPAPGGGESARTYTIAVANAIPSTPD